MLKNKFKIPQRKKDSHKGNFGKILIVAGSSGMIGAGVLCSRGALRSGSGLVYLAVPSDLKNIANLATPEVIVKSFEEIGSVSCDAIVAGPGLSLDIKNKEFIKKIIRISNVPIVLDAAALTILENSTSVFSGSKYGLILTPHAGEMSSLTGLQAPEIQANKKDIAKEFARKWNAYVVLKGFNTVVASPAGDIYVNKTGNPGMATAGSGDVLAGIIATFIAQKNSLFDSACMGTYAHGLAGDMAKKEKGEIGLIASDIIDNLPMAISRMQK